MKIGDRVRITVACPTGAYQVGDEGTVTGIAGDGDNRKWCFEVYFADQDDHWYVDENCAEVIDHARTH